VAAVRPVHVPKWHVASEWHGPMGKGGRGGGTAVASIVCIL
jgi:hypothetical protein